ncbi:GH3 family domain-containing protein [Ornithobacterium rhinotracheale]
MIWTGKVLWFSKSSVTTNAISKFIPITKESLEQNLFTSG